MKNPLFQSGKTYFSMARTTGTIKLFKVSKILKGKETGKRLYVVASYDGKPEQKYPIRTLPNGCEVVDIDKRLCTIIDTTEYGGSN